MKITVSELIVKYMEHLGIEYIFGMPGAHILPVYDRLYDSSIQAVLAKHEQGAAFMAGGYAKAAERISACITTAGPGATNLITGIANAYADKQPILVITGETSTHIFGKGGLQESSGEGGSIDQSILFNSITRYSKVIERTDYLDQVLNQTSKALLSANPGPVLLSLPFNVQKELVDEDILESIKTKGRVYTIDKYSPPVEALTRLIMEAQHPVIVAGYGCIRSGAQEVITQLSETLNIPVATSLKGKGVIDEQSNMSLGSLGVTSSGVAYGYIVEQADLVLFLGASFNERTSYLWNKELLENKKVAQIDSNADQLEKVFEADIAIQGDINEVLSGVFSNLQEKGASRKEFSGVAACNGTQIKHGSEKYASLSRGKFSVVEKFFAELAKQFPQDAFFFDDNIIFAQNFFNVSSRNRYFPNSGISSLGHAIPAAIGARFSAAKPTFAILGDGGFQMCCMEIMTAINYNIPLNVVLFNNSTMGLIRKNQSQLYNERFINCDFINPDYAYLAKSFGINHYKVSSATDVDELFATRDLVNAINLIEIMIDKNAFPNYRSGR